MTGVGRAVFPGGTIPAGRHSRYAPASKSFGSEPGNTGLFNMEFGG